MKSVSEVYSPRSSALRPAAAMSRVFPPAVDVGGHPGVDRADDQRGHLGALAGQLGPGDAGQEERGRGSSRP
jgi:hypothetical protein